MIPEWINMRGPQPTDQRISLGMTATVGLELETTSLRMAFCMIPFCYLNRMHFICIHIFTPTET